jgi:IMP dehydrogenase
LVGDTVKGMVLFMSFMILRLCLNVNIHGLLYFNITWPLIRRISSYKEFLLYITKIISGFVDARNHSGSAFRKLQASSLYNKVSLCYIVLAMKGREKIKGYTFDDVLIVPTFNDEVISRRDIDKSSSITNINGKEIRLSLPIFSSPMSYFWKNFAEIFTKHRLLFAVSRINRPIEERIDLIKDLGENSIYTAISIGPREVEDHSFRKKFEKNLDYYSFVLVDTAFGSTNLVVNTLIYLNSLGIDKGVIVGNIASVEGLYYLAKNTWEKYKEIIIRVGIGSGSACTTRLMSGVGFPQMSILEIIAKILGKTDLDKGIHELSEEFLWKYEDLIEKIKEGFSVKIISDGGIKYYGDIAKALVFSDFVMSGKLFISKEMETYDKSTGIARYYGMASTYVGNRYAEGDVYLSKDPPGLEEIINTINYALGSSMSYVGAKSLDEFRKKADFVQVSVRTWFSENGVG